MKHLDIRITGRVTGVGFRFYAMQAAYRYGVNGTVRNLPDKSVLIEAEADDVTLESFLCWCRKGPLGARIDLVQTAESSVKHYCSFEILHTSSLP